MLAARWQSAGMPTTHSNELNRKIEALVQEHVASLRADAHAALERTFQHLAAGRPAQKKQSGRGQKTATPGGKRRTPAELSSLSERLYELICKKPGETMTVLAAELGLSPRELGLSARQLKDGGRVRTAGARNQMRYFPLVKASRQAG